MKPNAPEFPAEGDTVAARPPATSTPRPCIHCGEPSDCDPDLPDDQVFCCNGCRGAYQLIHGWGLEDFYGLRDQLAGGSAGSVRGEASQYTAFDNAEFLGRSNPIIRDDGLSCSRLAIHGLHCGACAWLIENAAQRTPGWGLARVRMSDHTLEIVYDQEQTSLPKIARLLDRLGYELAPLSEDQNDHFRSENRRLLIQIAIAGFCAANAMWIAIALYAGDASGVADEHRFFMRMIGTVLGAAAVAIPGRTFFQGALASLKTRTPHMDLPVALGLSVGTIVGSYNAITGTGDLYFDSLAVLVFLLLIGRWIQFHQQQRAARSVDLLLRITPRHAARVRGDDGVDLVLVDNLQAGDVIRVAAGENVAADGRVCAGQSSLDRSLLTGESLPVPVSLDDEVAAGTVNLTSPIDVTVTATGSASRIGKVMRHVEDAIAEKTPIVQLADRIGGVFVVVVSTLAVGTFAWWMSAGLSVAASHATALLIVACPCALALATPLAIAVSIGRAARRQTLIRDGGALQQLAAPGIVWFDKTGTLTDGKPEAKLLWGDPQSIADAAAIEQHCGHPIADAVVRLATGHKFTFSSDGELIENTRHGLIGLVEGRSILIGNKALLDSHHVTIPDHLTSLRNDCLQTGSSPLWIATDGKVTAMLSLSAELKVGAKHTVTALQNAGWQVGILSGDHERIVQYVATQLGIPGEQARGELSPEDKLSIVRSTHQSSTVSKSERATTVMIGDGANDAAALAAADVGIAVRGGAEVSLQAAPIYCASGKLESIDKLFVSARRTGWLIRAAFAVSLTYNVVAVTLAMTGTISPLLAAVLMPISSVSVLALVLAWPTYPVGGSE